MTKFCRRCKRTKDLTEFRFINAKENYSSPCKECRYAKTQAWIQRNPDKMRAARKRSSVKHSAKNKARAKRWATLNPGRARARRQTYAARNKDRMAEYKRLWKGRNPDRRNAARMNYLAQKIQATPAWLSKEDRFRINFFYTAARFFTWMTGISFEVDHIVPLRGKTVRGLHVPWNLQVLPADLNNRKSNKLTI